MHTLALCFALAVQAVPPDEAVRRMKVPDGFEVRLVAAEPTIRQPVSISFDRRGRLWVLQYLQYPTPAGLKALKVDEFLRTVYDRVPEPPPKGPKGADRLTILEDRDGDGSYETSKDFLSGLNLASGFCIGYGGVYVAQPPYLLFYADRNGDDVPDGDPEVLLSGFGQEDAHAYANSLQWGPDGWLYGAQGSTVTAKIRGVEFQQGLWRFHPITKEFELFAEGGGNTWGLDFDRHGAAIAGTNFGGSAMLHQVQGAYYLKGFGKHGPLHNPNTYGYFEHVPYPGFKGGHVTCGGTVYQGGAFPKEFDDQYIACNVLSNDLYWHRIEPQGSSFTNRFGGDFLVSNDKWFRPIDTLIGPDGALYVVDWYDARANHVDPRDNWDRTNGRIYRVRHASSSKRPLVLSLDDPNVWVRREARLEMAERRDPAVVERLLRELRAGGNVERLWALAGMGAVDESLALNLLTHPEEDVRAWAIRLRGDTRKISAEFRSALLSLAKREPSARVRNQLACTAKRLPAADATPIIVELLGRAEDVEDPQIPMLLWWAMEDKAVLDKDQLPSLLRAAGETPIGRKFILERIARRIMTEGAYAACALLLKNVPEPESKLRLLQGFEKALEGKRLDQVPAPLQEPLAELLKAEPDNASLLALAIRLGSDEVYRNLLARLSTSSLPEPLAARLIPLLGQIGNPDALPTLFAFLQSSSPTLRGAALGALQAYADPEVAQAVLRALPALNGALRNRALGLLSARAPSSLALLRAVDAGAMKPAELPAAELQKIAAYEDPEIARLVAKHWGKVGPATAGEKRAQIGSWRNILNQGKGDRARGHATFQKLCAVCHTLWNEGNKIGPELTGADRKTFDVLALNIVDPSAMIRPEFTAHQVLTTDGQVLTGLLVEQSAQAVTLLDAQNARTVLSRDRLQAFKPATLSLMPEKLLDALTDPEIRDFFAYLQGEGPVAAAAPLKVCLISGSLEYESDASLAALQEHLEKNYNVVCTRAFRKTDEDLPGLENLESADVAVIFTRRLKLSGDQLERVKKYCESGKPVVGIRTASHAFQTWLELDKEVLGGSYANHYGKGPEIAAEVTEKGKGHPILEGVGALRSAASLYRNPSNAADTETLLMGKAGDKVEPLAWTRERKGGRVFYTSLGDQGDFKNDAYLRLITNALFWTAKRAPEKKQAKADGPFPGTALLETPGDLSMAMIAGIDRFLLREIELSVGRRPKPDREKLARMIGVVDPRIPFEYPEQFTTVNRPAVIARNDDVAVYAIRWPVFRGVEGEGLLLLPLRNDAKNSVIVIPDADQTPEQLCGLAPGLEKGDQIALLEARSGNRVVVPFLIDRSDTHSVSAAGRGTNQPHREFIYRPAFEMGRHIIGYEVQKVLALVDWLSQRKDSSLSIEGAGEGGLIALYASALDPRIGFTEVNDYFASRQQAWQEPIYRNVFGLLSSFGDAEIASLGSTEHFYPGAFRSFSIEGPPAPRPGRAGAAPGAWRSPDGKAVTAELDRYLELRGLGKRPQYELKARKLEGPPLKWIGDPIDPAPRLKRQFDQLVEDTQVLLRRSEGVRNEYFWKNIDRKSLEGFEKSTAPFRGKFYDEVIGRFELPLLPSRPRSRLLYEEPTYRAYEVVLDVFADVFAYGLLLVPKDIKDGERRPVVVCQHGLEGRPQDLADPKKDVPAYGRYGCKLAERGFIVFAPQNPYLGRDAFRTLQRKANLLGKQLFSLIIPQHQAITDWLASLPIVDPERIAFYGISYGGKTAMRVPAVLKRYCLSICSADFNDWIWKNAATDSPYSYVTTNEYEIFEWNLGNTFNYAEMAALIAPRPFMVERGHGDGVAPDERVAYEYAKVKRLYDELRIGDLTEMEVFDGPHKINGVGTFAFLHKHLNWPEPRSK